MPDNSTAPSPQQPDPHHAIVAALSEGGPRNAGQLAKHIGIPYSTLTPRLRQLEEQGRAERIKDPLTHQIIWQVTAAAPSRDIAAEDDSDTAIDSDGAQAQAITDSTTLADEPGDDTTEDDTTGVAAERADRDSADNDSVKAQAIADSTEPADDGTDKHDGSDDADPEDRSTNADSPTPPRRQKGAIPAAILEVTRANPDDTFKVSQLKNALQGASAGAIANAAAKLVVSGELVCVCESPATYQAA